ncbi:class I SAM-dependent methyltransferase [Kamptonema cortianum]|nr:class I SAM-dependent methyltransferase [Kamptonema cortianum]
MQPESRFDNRAVYYHRSRPRYPRRLIDLLAAEVGLTSAAIIADFGCGTGLSSEPFLEIGAVVYGIEPSRAMREIAAEMYGSRPNFQVSDGTAEASGLPDQSVDLVIAGQAFHWFHPERARDEVRRIARPDGWAILFWNSRVGDSPFLRAYNALVSRFDQDGTEKLNKGSAAEEQGQIARFFGTEYRSARLANPQTMDFDTLCDRLRSASYLPLPGMPGYDEMMTEARAIFKAHAKQGTVTLDYCVEVYWQAVRKLSPSAG